MIQIGPMGQLSLESLGKLLIWKGANTGLAQSHGACKWTTGIGK